MGNQWQDVALICEPDAKNPPSAPAKFTTMTRAAISIMVACLLVIAVALPILHFREVGERGKPFFSLSFLVLLSGFLEGFIVLFNGDMFFFLMFKSVLGSRYLFIYCYYFLRNYGFVEFENYAENVFFNEMKRI